MEGTLQLNSDIQLSLITKDLAQAKSVIVSVMQLMITPVAVVVVAAQYE